MRRGYFYFYAITFTAVMVGVFFCSQKSMAMPVGTLLYRTSAQGRLYGYGGQYDLVEFKGDASSTLPKLRINCGHAGLYVGKIDGVDMVLESVPNGVQLTPAQYFINDNEGERLVGARFPKSDKINKMGDDLFKLKINQIATFFKENQIGYDFEFKNQKGPEDKQWTCVGLTEKIYESLSFNGDFLITDFVYDPNQYFIDITPDGLDNDSGDVANPYTLDIFSGTLEFSKISRREFEKDGYALGKVVDGDRYFFLPYTQYLQKNVLKDVPVDINLHSSFEAEEIRGKTPSWVYIAYADNISGGKITSAKEKTKEIGDNIASAASQTKSALASAWSSVSSFTASAIDSLKQALPDFLKGVGEASIASKGIPVKGDGSSGVSPYIAEMNKAKEVLAIEEDKISVKEEESVKVIDRPAKSNVVVDKKPVAEVKAKEIQPLKIDNKQEEKIPTSTKPVESLNHEAGDSVGLASSSKGLAKEVGGGLVEVATSTETEVSSSTNTWPILPLVHYPPSSGSGSSSPTPEVGPLTEEAVIAVPSFKYFRLADRQSGDTAITADRLVRVLLEVDDASSVDGYFLSEIPILGTSTAWLDIVPDDFLLSDGDGEKVVYSWISYAPSSVSSSSASIVLSLPTSTVASTTATSSESTPLIERVLISEFATRGPAGAYDEFVELYNPNEDDIDVAGWQLLSKSSSASSSWLARTGSGLPQINIPARGFLLLAANAYSLPVEPDYRHTANWGLSDSGGGLMLIDASANEVDHVFYGEVASSGEALCGFGVSKFTVAERKASAESTLKSLFLTERWAGNSYDGPDAFVLKIESDPQNSLSIREPNDFSAVKPAAISDLLASSTRASLVVLSWTSPENGKILDSANYDIRYVEKVSDCSIDFVWDNAQRVATSVSPSDVGEMESIKLGGLPAGKVLCFAIKTLNGYNISDISNFAEVDVPLPPPEMEEYVDQDFSPTDNPMGLHMYYPFNYQFLVAQTFVPSQDNVSAIALFGKRYGGFTLRLCEGDLDLTDSMEANWDCSLDGQSLLGEVSVGENTFPPCADNPWISNPCYSSVVFTKIDFPEPIQVNPGKQHFFMLSGPGNITLVGIAKDHWSSIGYPFGHYYAAPWTDKDFLFKTYYVDYP